MAAAIIKRHPPHTLYKWTASGCRHTLFKWHCRKMHHHTQSSFYHRMQENNNKRRKKATQARNQHYQSIPTKQNNNKKKSSDPQNGRMCTLISCPHTFKWTQRPSCNACNDEICIKISESISNWSHTQCNRLLPLENASQIRQRTGSNGNNNNQKILHWQCSSFQLPLRSRNEGYPFLHFPIKNF